MKLDDVMTTQEAGERWNVPADSIKPVSYTHLDVYKRQGENPIVYYRYGCSCRLTSKWGIIR